MYCVKISAWRMPWTPQKGHQWKRGFLQAERTRADTAYGAMLEAASVIARRGIAADFPAGCPSFTFDPAFGRI